MFRAQKVLVAVDFSETSDRADRPATRRHAHHGEEPAPDERTDNADDDVADNAEAAALHDDARQPSRDEPDENEPDKFHGLPPL